MFHCYQTTHSNDNEYNKINDTTIDILPPIHGECDIWILHQNQEGVGDHLKVSEKYSFSIKDIYIYVLLCCCSKSKRVKKNNKNKNETFSVNWSN